MPSETLESSRLQDYRMDYRLGIKMGISISKKDNNQENNLETMPSYGVVSGVTFAVPLSKNFGLQPELIFAQRGFKVNPIEPNSLGKFTRRSSYLDVPLYFAFKPFRFMQILLGPQYSHLIDQRDTPATSNNFDPGASADFTAKSNMNRVCISGGVDFQIQNLVLGLRAGTYLSNENSLNGSSWEEYKNIWTQLTACYSFPF